MYVSTFQEITAVRRLPRPEELQPYTYAAFGGEGSQTTPFAVSVRTREIPRSGKDDTDPSRYLGLGIALGQLVNGAERMLVIELEDPKAPTGTVPVLGCEVWWRTITPITELTKPEVSAYAYAQAVNTQKHDPRNSWFYNE